VPNWCQFLSARTDQELETLAMSDPDIERAKPALDDLSADPKARELARDREIWHYFYDRGLQLAERGGREKGIAEGRAEGREVGRAKGIAEGLVRAVRTACELLGVEFTAARQAHLAQASTAELEQLLDSLERDRRWPD